MRHDQLSLFRNGGKRRGAGRKPAHGRAGTPHDKRPELDGTNALHVTLRMAPEVGCMRRRGMYRAIRAATRVAAKRDSFRIVHLSIQGTHVHMLVEASSKQTLARGMQGFKISAARHINAHHRRHGRVFADRYHLVVITSPTQMRHTLSYVLNNWRHHSDALPAPGWLVDPFSTGFAFTGWREHPGSLFPPGAYDWLVVRPPESWLLRTGWRLAGSATISALEAPGGHDE